LGIGKKKISQDIFWIRGLAFGDAKNGELYAMTLHSPKGFIDIEINMQMRLESF